jgi:hypothetical protein
VTKAGRFLVGAVRVDGGWAVEQVGYADGYRKRRHILKGGSWSAWSPVDDRTPGAAMPKGVLVLEEAAAYRVARERSEA